MSRTIVVIGGAGGGPVAAARARELDEHARIVLVEKRSHVSWVQAGLRHHLEGMVTRLAELDEDRRQFFADRHRIELRTGTEAVRLDPDSHRLVLRTSVGQETLRYDAAIFSGGAEIGSAGAGLSVGQPGVTGFRTKDDLEALQQLLRAGAKKAVVVGAGPFGIDAAMGLRKVGLSVHVVERNERVLPSLSLLGARAAQRALVDVGVVLHLKNPITNVDKHGTQSRLTLANGTVIDADVVILTTGLRPRTELLSEAGAALNADGSVRVNARMETTLPSIYACGSAVSVTHAVTRAPLWLPQAAIATRTAQIAGHNAVVDNSKETLSPLAGTAFYVVGNTHFGRTGLSESEARSFLGDDRVFVVTIHGYAGEPWVGGDALCVRLVVDRHKVSAGHPHPGVVVGGEVWGKEGVPRRIDLLAAAVADGWSPDRVADLDMAYAPTLGPAFDPLQIAGQVAAQTITGEASPIGAEALALRVLKNDVVLVDVSRPGKPGPWPQTALRIPLEALRERLAEIPRDKLVVTVSQTGQRAYQAFRILKQRGLSQVQHLDGGALSYAFTLD
ncbi:MAG: FAD-dependent oxidoreductase [Deltaproteobacteria bacterium]|nr:FAD-dependent oxidoreductase [Deltaproteobacteria bacterium]